jgi:hypothetical protein
MASMLKVNAKKFLDQAQRSSNDWGDTSWVTQIKGDKFFIWMHHGLIASGGRFSCSNRSYRKIFDYKERWLYAAFCSYFEDGVTAFFYVDRPCVRRKLTSLGIKFTVTDELALAKKYKVYDKKTGLGVKSFKGRWPTRRWVKGRKRIYLGIDK